MKTELTQVGQVASTTSTKLGEVSTDVTNVKSEVASTKTELESTIADLKRARGDLDNTSSLVATNGKELAGAEGPWASAITPNSPSPSPRKRARWAM